MAFLSALAVIIVASIVIMYACDGFDDAAAYLGRNMAPGVRGATINAIGSSLPEMMTAFFLLFLYHDQDGFAAGIATTAGSAIFNSVVIPALCIFVVRYRGVIIAGAGELPQKIRAIQISKPSLIRDGIFLLIAQLALIWFMGGAAMSWWMGAALMAIYAVYFVVLARGFGANPDSPDDGQTCTDNDDGDTGDDDDDAATRPSTLRALLTLDVNHLLFAGRPLTGSSAWVVLGLTTFIIAAACWGLAEAVMISADALGVPAYFTALIFAAAATSVPDTILSLKDAVRGEYDDALANAMGSNTFDITVALGLPLLAYSLIHGADVVIMSSDAAHDLRFVLFGVTLVVFASLLIPRRLTVANAYLLAGMYGVWMAYVLIDTFGARAG